nr:hypothetical protein [Tanacetum cinerariifolium]
MFIRIGFDSTIELVSFDKSQVVTFNGKFIHGFKNGDCGTKSQSDNTIGSPHGFFIYEIEVVKGNEKVTEVIDVKNWRVGNSRLLSDNDDNDNGGNEDHDDDSDNERTKSDRDEILDPNLTNVDQTEHEEENFDKRVHTPSDYELTDYEKILDEENINKEE